MIFQKNFTVTAELTDEYGSMKPSAVLYFTQEAAAAHCDLLGCNWEAIAKKGLFWAVMRHRIQISRLPRLDEVIRVETWPMPTTRTCYPRSMAAYDEAGQLLFRVHSLWVLMDVNSRTMVLPGKSGVTVDGILQGTELLTPQSLPPKPQENISLRCVTAADTDRNGHMNNVRYLDWVFELLSQNFLQKNIPGEISLCYVSEAREGEVLSVGWTHTQDNALHVEVTEQTQNRRIFGALVSFG